MITVFGVVCAFAAGTAIGLGYVAGLWITVRALPGARQPALLVFASYVMRVGGAAVLLVLLVRGGGWPWLAAGLAGFVLARMVTVRRFAAAAAAADEP